jgi:tetratricopeptide (TPR) repeat protein
VSAAPADQPAFEISIEDGRGLLLLRPRTFFGWLAVEKLELEIPEVSFPLDITRGIKQFQGQRCKLVGATFALDAAGASAFVRGRAPLLAAAGFEQVRVRLRGGMAELGASARVGGLEAELGAHATFDVDGRDLRVRLAQAFTFGFLRRPAPLLAHDLLCLLFGASPGSDGEETDAPVAVGLAEVLLHPLDLLLQRLLPSAGWRLPDADGVRLIGSTLTNGRVELRYGAGSVEAAGGDTIGRPAAPVGDALLLRNDLSGAAAAYRAGPAGDRLLVERRLAVACARDGSLREAETVARAALDEWPDFQPARLALAAVALARGRSQEAAEQFAQVMEAAESAGHVEMVVRAALVGARSLSDSDPARAAAFYERALRDRPDEEQAARALAELYAALGRWRELERLLSARAAAAPVDDPRAQAALQLRLGELLLGKLGEPAAARDVLAAVTRLDAENPQAWDLLARAHLQLDEPRAAIAALEQLAARPAVGEDPAWQARVEVRVARILVELGEPDEGLRRYRRARALAPDDAEILESAAQLAARQGDLPGAIADYRQLVALRAAQPMRLRLAADELLKLLLAAGELDAAHRLIAETGEPAAEISITLAAREEAAGQLDAAVASLRRAAERVAPERGAELELERARLLCRIGRDGEEDALETAHRLAPHAPAGVAAARRLAERARTVGDGAREAAWLDGLLAGPRPADVVELVLRRAQLHVERGEPARAQALLDELSADGAASGGPAARVEALRRLRADVLGTLGDASGRAVELEALAAEHADPVERLVLLVDAANSRMIAGDLAAARATAVRAAALAPGDPLVRGVLAELAWRERAWDEVVALAQLLLPGAVGQEHVEWARRLGTALERLGRIPEALAAHRAAVEGEGEGEPLAASFVRLGELLQRSGDYAGAVEALRAVGTDERTGEDAVARADHLRRAAELLHRRLGRSEEAIALYDEALRRAPGHLPASDALESLFAELGDERRVAALLRHKLQAGLDGARADEWLPRLVELEARLDAPLADRRRSLGALAELQRAGAREPELLDTLAQLAAIAGDAAERLGYERERARILGEPADDERWREILWAPLPPARPPAEVAELERELAALPSEAIDRRRALRLELAECCAAAGEHTAARAHLEWLIAEEPSQRDALAQLAALATDEGHFDEAVTLLERCSRLVDTRAEQVAMLYRMGELCLGPLRDPERAAEAYLKAIDLDPHHIPTLRRLIDDYARRGDAKSVAELTADLDHVGGLLVEATPAVTRARAALACALVGNEAAALPVARTLGSAAAAVAQALVEAEAHAPSPRALVAAAQVLCRAPGPSLAEVRAALAGRAARLAASF